MDESQPPAQPREGIDDIVPFVYEQLRAIAHRRLSARGRTSTISTTALVHEAYLKLVNPSNATWQDRSHFFAVASTAMRHVLLDRAKARLAVKRGGEQRQVSLDDDI